LFAHDFGDLRAELKGRLECSVSLENSYLVDASRILIDWCRNQGMALIDMNLFHQASDPTVESNITKQALTYIWDNYIEISKAHNVVLIGYGSACEPLLSFMGTRSVQRLVRAVVQVIGHHPIPQARGDKMKLWYPTVSFVVLPRNHTIFNANDTMRYRNVKISSETSSIRTLVSSSDEIQRFVQTKLDTVTNLRREPAQPPETSVN